MTQQEFLESYGQLIKNISGQTGILPELALSVAIVEATDANHVFGAEWQAENGNNFFGIQADTGWTGDSVTDTAGRKWRKYDSPEDSVRDFFMYLKGNDSDVFKVKDLAGQAAALQADHYAGPDTNYANLLQQVAPTAKKLLDSVTGSEVTLVTVGAVASVIGLIVLLKPKGISGFNFKKTAPWLLGAAAVGGGLYYANSLVSKVETDADAATAAAKKTAAAATAAANQANKTAADADAVIAPVVKAENFASSAVDTVENAAKSAWSSVVNFF